MNTIGDVDYAPLSALSFGTAVTAQSPTNQISVFRTGAGAANAYPKVGPVVITEVMYHPADVGTNDNTVEEFIELRNTSVGTVVLFDPVYPTNGWRLRDAVDFQFNNSHSIPAGGSMILVSFDPATNALALAQFRASTARTFPRRSLFRASSTTARKASNWRGRMRRRPSVRTREPFPICSWTKWFIRIVAHGRRTRTVTVCRSSA
ncbi:MAG: lamin tail domain-containing protein [Verrucomicrobia bacterium]|nr:lamin tail domain-containing protein [Verrucomicrobiota bacterium]